MIKDRKVQNGIDENGAASREIAELQEGDVIIPLYDAFAIEGDDEYTYCGVEYTVTGKTNLTYHIMEDGDYYYAFCIDDIYGDYYLSDIAFFDVEDGKVGFNLYE